MKTKLLFSLLCVLSVFLSACGTSPEVATARPTSTVAPSTTPTIIPSATPTFTPLPTSSPTPVPLPGPDPKAMIAWKELGLSDDFRAFSASSSGIEEGANAFTLSNGKAYNIAGSFVFANGETPTQKVFGYTVLLPTEAEQKVFDQMIIDQIEAFGGLGLAELDTANDIADHSKGAEGDANNRNWTLVAFRVGEIGAIVIRWNKPNVVSEIDAIHIAGVYAKNIEQPQRYCFLTSVRSVPDAEVATFEFDANGFYPHEARYITLKGEFLLEAETKTATSAKMGLSGEAFDQAGYLSDVISFLTLDQIAEQGMQNAQFPEGPAEFTLVVGGHFSGCEVTQTVTWP